MRNDNWLLPHTGMVTGFRIFVWIEFRKTPTNPPITSIQKVMKTGQPMLLRHTPGLTDETQRIAKVGPPSSCKFYIINLRCWLRTVRSSTPTYTWFIVLPNGLWSRTLDLLSKKRLSLSLGPSRLPLSMRALYRRRNEMLLSKSWPEIKLTSSSLLRVNDGMTTGMLVSLVLTIN